MARKSLKDLVSKALGVDDTPTDGEAEELLDIVNESEEKEVVVATAPVAAEEVIKTPEVVEKTETAFNVAYNTTTRKYDLVTVAYKEDGTAKVISKEPFATVLPEVNYKVGQLLYEKLKYSLSMK
mgnify:CR=1 FL=1